MEYNFNFRGRRIIIKVKEMKRINKFLGMIIYREALFFRLQNRAIHSLFCPRFLAIWLDNDDKVIDYKFVDKWEFYIKPEKEFSGLIEIPVDKRYRKILDLFKF